MIEGICVLIQRRKRPRREKNKRNCERWDLEYSIRVDEDDDDEDEEKGEEIEADWDLLVNEERTASGKQLMKGVRELCLSLQIITCIYNMHRYLAATTCFNQNIKR